MLWFFGIVMGIGLLYLLLVIIGGLGDLFDLDSTLESIGIGGLLGIDAIDISDGLNALDNIDGVVDGLDAADMLEAADVLDAGDSLDAAGAAGEMQGIGCLTISAFMALFGAIGLVGVQSGRNLPLTLILATVISYAVARLITELLKYVYRQQSNSAYSTISLIGKTAQVTINSASGKTGEVMVLLAGGRIKYPVKEAHGNALKRGDTVKIIDIDGRYLHVEKLA